MDELRIGPQVFTALRRDGRCIIRLQCSCASAGCGDCEKKQLKKGQHLMLINSAREGEKLTVAVEEVSFDVVKIDIDVRLLTGMA